MKQSGKNKGSKIMITMILLASSSVEREI